jgi:hypothetical protein
MDDRVLDLKQWLTLLGGDLDYDYGTTEQPMGMQGILVLTPRCIDTGEQATRTSDIRELRFWEVAQVTTRSFHSDHSSTTARSGSRWVPEDGVSPCSCVYSTSSETLSSLSMNDIETSYV